MSKDVYQIDSVYVHGDWSTVLAIAHDLLSVEKAIVVAVKRYIDNRYINTFYLTTTP